MNIKLEDFEYLKINNEYYSDLYIGAGASKEKIWEAPTTATPVITAPIGGNVTITCSTSGATIYYKIDSGSYQQYTRAFNPGLSCTITAYATKTNYKQSGNVSASYIADYVLNQFTVDATATTLTILN